MIGGNIFQLIEQGGVVMYPLLLASVVSVALVIERNWSLARAARASKHLHRLVEDALSEHAITEASALCRRDRSVLAGAYRTIFAHLGADESTRGRLAQLQLAHGIRDLKRFVWLIGTIGSLAPFIGLLGTVLGIVRSFENMAATGSGGFTVVAAGISEALIATAAGLLVGVLSIFAYNALTVRIAALSADLRERTEEILIRVRDLPRQEEAGPRVVQAR